MMKKKKVKCKDCKFGTKVHGYSRHYNWKCDFGGVGTKKHGCKRGVPK